MSSRDLTAGMSAAIERGTVHPVIFVEGSFGATGSPNEEFLRLWSGYGSYTWDGKEWAGAGKLLRISPLAESSSVRASGFNIELSGLPQSLISLALAHTRQGRPGRVWLGMMERQGHLSLPGAAGNYASTPDSAANSITSDIDVRVQLSMADWTPAAEKTIISKWSAPSDRCWALNLMTTGALRLYLSADGSASVGALSSVALSVVDGESVWVRVTWNNTADEARFYTSEDGVAWTLLGTAQALSATGIFDGTAVLEIGSSTSGSGGLYSGNVMYAELRNGIDGPVVACFDPAASAQNGATSFVSSKTGETWTINSSGSPQSQLVVADDQLVDDPYLVRAGKMDYVSINASGNDTVITAQYEDRLIDLLRPRERRYTDIDQKFEFPTDTGFRFVAALQDKQLIWGGPGAATSPLAQPAPDYSTPFEYAYSTEDEGGAVRYYDEDGGRVRQDSDG